LEVGCNEGANLRAIQEIAPHIKLAGIDIHERAVDYAKHSLGDSDAKIVLGSVYEMDEYFKEKEFDMVFSMGVLVHFPPEMMGQLRAQIARVANHTTLHCEEPSSNPGPKRFDKGIPHRWTHDYIHMYSGFKIKVYRDIYEPGGGAHQLVVIDMNDNVAEASFVRKARIWYLCSLIPFFYKWSHFEWGKRLKIRWKVRGALFFFLPRFRFAEKKFLKK